MAEESGAGARTTIQDVARAAGVSMTTVSHALSGKGTISAATRERVVALAREMHYRPHPVAASLRGGRTGVLGLDIRPLDALGNYAPTGVDHFLRFAGAAAVTALSHGFRMMLVPDLSKEPGPVAGIAVDGYILGDPVEDDPVLGQLLAEGRPVVTVGRDPRRPDFSHWVNTDDEGAAREVLDLLWDRGARRISLVVGTDANSWNRDVEGAYRTWCAERGLPADAHALPEARGTEGGEQIGAELLSRPVPPDAIFCQTGRHAAGVCAAAASRGVAVPGSLLVVGGSDSEHTRAAQPPVTAIDLRPEDLGRAAVEMLLRLLDGADDVSPLVIRPRVVERSTTAALTGTPPSG